MPFSNTTRQSVGISAAFSAYDGALVAKVTEQSNLQVCYRTRPETEQDIAYSFHSGWAEVIEAAKRVMDLVQWLGSQQAHSYD